MARAQDSTIEGVGRAIDEAAEFLDKPNRDPKAWKLDTVLPIILMRQLLALNRLTDIAEELQDEVRELHQRMKRLESKQ